MNKPERPELFSRAQGLFKRAADAGGRAFRTARNAGESAWNKATAADDEGAKRRKRLILMTVGGLIAVIAVLSVISRLGGEGAAPTENTAPGQAVTVFTTAMSSFQPTIALNGEARPVRDIQVAAPATGVRIMQLMVDEGDMVREGQPMARLDSNLAQAQIRAAQASVAEAQSAAVRARGEYERAESIRDSGALSSEAIEARRAAAIAADARLAAARAQMQEVNARLGGGYVRAPASGLVIDRTAEVGRNVDGQVLFRIAADNQLEVAAHVAESDALALQVGQAATFSLVDGSTVEGTLRRGPASIDSRTRTGEALFSLPQGSRVRAGMFLRGNAVLAPHDVLAIPQSSILYDNGQAYVYVVDGQDLVHRANIDVGARNGDLVEVRSGLTENQRIVGSGAAFLQDGDQVRPLEHEPAASTDLRGREG
jgi:RND family efflux transporter MFP subunit